MSSGDPLVILNPVAGPAQRQPGAERLRAALRKAGLPDRWEETRPDRDADRIVRESSSRGPVVVLGGDGTVQAAARALRGGDRPLAIVPLGSGNVMALRLDIPLSLERALEVASQGVCRRLDLGLCESQPFLLGAGMGVDGRLVRDATRKLKRQMGQLAYLVSAARNVPVRHHRFTLIVDGRTVEENAASVVVANFGTQFGPWIFPPDADGGDGVLDVAAVRAGSFSEVMSLLTAPFRLRPREHKGIRLLRGREVRVVCPQPLPLQVDGEDRGDRNDIRVGIEPGALPVLVSRHRPSRPWSREWPPPLGKSWEPWDRGEASEEGEGPDQPPDPERNGSPQGDR